MRTAVTLSLLLTGIATCAAAADATFIDKADVAKVLASAPSGDHTMRVLDMGSYQLSVAVDHRAPTAPSGAAPAAATGAPAAKPEPCGATAMPANAGEGVRGMIYHDVTSETYIITEGGGTILTGGQIVNGGRVAAASDVTKLQGPSCSGLAYGPVTRRAMKVGDIVVIPAGVPHGWSDLSPTGVTYLSVRPDTTKVLSQGYVNPALK